MDDDENNIFSDSQNFYSTQNFNHSQTFNPSQDYFPSFDDFSNSSQFKTNMNASNASHGWSEQEDIALMSAWCFISTNACVGTNRTSVNLWENILDQYEKIRKENPTMGEQRSLESLRQRYRRLNTNVSKWIGAYKHAHDRATSGQSNEDIEKAAQQFYGKSKLTHHKVFESVMRHNPKWELKLNSTSSSRFQQMTTTLKKVVEAQKRDATGLLGMSAIQKCTAAMRMLVYGAAADLHDEYLRMSAQLIRKSLIKFVESVIFNFGDEYLRKPTEEDLARLLHIGEQRGFPGMLGSTDCMH